MYAYWAKALETPDDDSQDVEEEHSESSWSPPRRRLADASIDSLVLALSRKSGKPQEIMMRMLDTDLGEANWDSFFIRMLQARLTHQILDQFSPSQNSEQEEESTEKEDIEIAKYFGLLD